MNDNLYIGSEAREKIMNGVRKCSLAVGSTMGTSGNNSLLETFDYPGISTTNDGATILAALHFSDPLEEIGRKILMEAVSRANKASGDGSSTTCVLTAAILEEGISRLSSEIAPMDIKKSLEGCIPQIEEELKKQAIEITPDNVAPVASISAEDESIGQMIQEIYQQIGKDGIVSWDVSKTPNDYYVLGKGLTIKDAGYITPYMCDMDEKSGLLKNTARLKDPKILLCQQKITSGLDFEELFKKLYSQDIREIVVFCNEIEPNVASDLVKTRAIRGFRTLVIKMPILWNDEWWKDLVIATGATIINPNDGLSLRDVEEKHLGTVEYLTANKDEVNIEGTKDLLSHIADLQAEGSNESLVRAARLNVRTARYFVGALSEQALYHRRLKVEDALNAAACALNNGVVVGGGVALLNVATSGLQGIGGEILKKALVSPMENIVKNAGKELKDIGEVGDSIGFNSKTGKTEDLVGAKVLDPLDVVLNAIKSAIGVAATILTVGTVALLQRDAISKDL